MHKAVEELLESSDGGKWHDALEVRFRRRPFILRPERVGEESWRGVLERLWESRGRGRSYVDDHFFPQLSRAGEELGVQWDFGGNVGNSMDSLRLVFWTGELETEGRVPVGTQERLCKHLGTGHFERRECVGSRSVLVEAARHIFSSLEAEASTEGQRESFAALGKEAGELIHDKDRLLADVWASIEREHSLGHHSIPIVFLKAEDGQVLEQVHGASDRVTYLQALRRAAVQL